MRRGQIIRYGLGTGLKFDGGFMATKTQTLIYIIVLAVFDTIIPIPITALVLIHVLYQKPKWFRDWVEEVYHS
jgi:hypothetical protein